MKRHLTHGFVLMFIFLLAVGAVLYYSDLKFTGYDVSDGTGEVTADSTTTDTTETTADTTEEAAETEEETTEETTETTEETTETTEETTETGEENADINITELSGETCTPSWICGNWTSCSSGTQTRACTDSNTCGSQEGIPATTQSCTYCGDSTCDNNEDCDSCSSDCGECEEETTTDTSEEDEPNVVIPTTTLVTTNVITNTCTPSWTCGDWQECINSVQIRVCTDANTCGSQEGILATTQSCVVEIKETCFDEIKNQNEENIDCGGICEKKCGFFSIVGSVVSGSVEAGRKFVFEGMFGNITRIIISIGSLVLIIGGFIAARFFIGRKKGVKKLDKAIDNLSDNKDSKDDASKDDSKLEYYY